MATQAPLEQLIEWVLQAVGRVLGQHYAIRWAKEDLDLEKAKGGDENRDIKEEVGSKVAKSLSSASTLDWVIRFNSVLFPALV